MGYEERSLIAREFLGEFFLFVIARNRLKIKFKVKFDIVEIKELVKYSFKMLVSRGTELAYYKLPVLLIGYIYGSPLWAYLFKLFILFL